MTFPKATPQLTYQVVLCAMASILVVVAYHTTGHLWGSLLTAALVYEGWTIESNTNSTISEILWILSARPLVPWAAGFATGWAIYTHHLQDPFLILFVGLMSGHFWFQRKQ